jgi:hypothetical protein
MPRNSAVFSYKIPPQLFKCMKLGIYFRASTRYQIHSPLLYDFCLEVLDNNKYYYAYDKLKEEWQSEITLHRKSTSLKHLHFLFRISQWYQADFIYEQSKTPKVVKDALILGNIDANYLDFINKDSHFLGSKVDQSTRENSALKKHLIYSQNPFIPLHYIENLAESSFLLIIDNVFNNYENYKQWKSLSSTFIQPVYTIQTSRFGLILGAKEIIHSEYFNLLPLRSKPFKII